MRKVLIGLGVIVVIILIAVLTLPKFIDVNHYRPQIEAELEQRLGRDVSLGPMSLSLFPLAFRVHNATISEDPDFSTGRPFAETATLFVSPEFFPLLRREIRISKLELLDPKLEFVRNEKGVWNFASILAHKKDTGNRFSLDQLKVFNGQIGITDLRQDKSRTQYDHIDLLVSGFAPERSFNVETRAHMPGSGEQMIVLKGKAGPLDSNRDLIRTPFNGDLTLTGVSFSGLQQFIKASALNDSEGVLTGSAYVSNENGMLASHGRFDIRNARIRGVDIGYPIGTDYDVTSNLDDEMVRIEKADLKLGQTPVSVTGSVDAKPDTAFLDLNVQALNASIRELARLAAAAGLAFNSKTTVDGKVDLDIKANGPATKPALAGRIAARAVDIRGGDLRDPVYADSIALTMTPAEIRSNTFTARTGRTAVTAEFSLSDYAAANPQIRLKLNSNNADVGELLRIGRAYGVAAVDGLAGSGTATINVEAAGPTQHLNQLAMNGSGAVRNTSFQMPSMAEALQLRNADLRFTANSVILDNVDAGLGHTAARGRVTVRDFSDPHLEFSLAANQASVQELESIFKAQNKPGSDRNVLSRFTGSGQLTVDKVTYDQVTLSNLRATVALNHGVVTLKPLTANVYDGRQSGAVVIDTRAHPATYTVDSKLENVDANQLLSSISSIKETIYGRLGANADLRFVTTAGSTNIVRSLTGRASMHLKDGRIAHLDFLHGLATIGQFQRTADVMQPFTDVVQLTGDFDINNGVARTRNLKAVIPEGSLAAEGMIDLVQQALNLRLTAVLSKNYAEKLGGVTNVVGFMNTVLANRDGELVIPVILTGNIRSPQFAPDLQTVAQMKLENLVPNLQNPADWKNGIFGEIFRNQPQQNPPPEQDNKPQRPGKTLQDLLDKVLKPRQP